MSTGKEVDTETAIQRREEQSPSDEPRTNLSTDDGFKQHGVSKVEALSQAWGKWGLITAYAGVFLGSIMVSLEVMTTFAFTPAATSAFSLHSLLSTVAVVTNVMFATVKPPVAKIADVFGRIEALSVSLVFLILGFIMKAASNNVSTFAASNIFYAAGSTGVGIVIQIFVADTTSLLNRALFSSLPDFPYVATTWIGPELVQAIGPQENWRWGFGMWAIIIPISFLPLLYSLVANELKAKKMGLLPPSNFRGLSFVSAAKKTWVDLDMMGLILFTAGLIMVLVPLTLTGVYNKLWDWSSARTICLVVFGFIVLGLFVAWESMPRLCARPMMSLKLIKDPTVGGGCALAFFYFFVFYLPSPYFYTWLQVVRNSTAREAGNISNTFTFSSCTSSIIISLAIKYTGNYKWWMMAGIPIYVLGYGLMIAFRTSDSTIPQVVWAQILTGLGGGAINVPAQVGLQAVCKHQDVAIATAMFLTMANVGGAVGSAVTGAIWSNLLPGYLETNLRGTLAAGNVTDIYSNYFNALTFEMGSPERNGIAKAYSDVYRIQLIVACCLAIPMIPLGLMMKNINLREVNLSNVEGVVVGGEKDTVVNPEYTAGNEAPPQYSSAGR